MIDDHFFGCHFPIADVAFFSYSGQKKAEGVVPTVRIMRLDKHGRARETSQAGSWNNRVLFLPKRRVFVSNTVGSIW